MAWPVFSMYRWHSPYTAGTSHTDWEGNYSSDCLTYTATTHTFNTLGHTTLCSGDIFQSLATMCGAVPGGGLSAITKISFRLEQ